jgi:hypothetical protein
VQQALFLVLLRPRGAQPAAILGVNLRKSDSGPFFYKLVQTNAPRTRKGLEPLVLGNRQLDSER